MPFVAFITVKGSLITTAVRAGSVVVVPVLVSLLCKCFGVALIINVIVKATSHIRSHLSAVTHKALYS
jgi:hypothetical protein